MLTTAGSLDPAPTLKGVDFTIPAPQPQLSWPVTGGLYDGYIDHVDAGSNFQVEVYDPSPAQARALVAGGQILPIVAGKETVARATAKTTTAPGL